MHVYGLCRKAINKVNVRSKCSHFFRLLLLVFGVCQPPQHVFRFTYSFKNFVLRNLRPWPLLLSCSCPEFSWTHLTLFCDLKFFHFWDADSLSSIFLMLFLLRYCVVFFFIILLFYCCFFTFFSVLIVVLFPFCKNFCVVIVISYNQPQYLWKKWIIVFDILCI